MKNNIYFLLINILVISTVQFITSLPWWFFLLVSLSMGFLFSLKNSNIRPFISGFISGFLNWSVLSLVLHYLYGGIFINKVAVIFYLSPALYFVIVGIICGLLNGLACYTGYCIFAKEDLLEVD